MKIDTSMWHNYHREGGSFPTIRKSGRYRTSGVSILSTDQLERANIQFAARTVAQRPTADLTVECGRATSLAANRKPAQVLGVNG